MGRTYCRWLLAFWAVFLPCTSASFADGKRDQAAKAAASRVRKQSILASWYGESFKGRLTASGTVFNPQELTAAHRTLRLGTWVRLTEPASGRSVVVRITDRGPYFPGRDIDLSYGAARKLGIVRRGVARVFLEHLRPSERPDRQRPVVIASAWPRFWRLPRAIVQ